MPALPPGIEPIPSSEYMIDHDGGEYNHERNTIRKRRFFLAAAAFLALIMTAVAIAHRAQAGAFRTIDVPDYVWDVCRGDENDSDILCYRAGDEYACSCECYDTDSRGRRGGIPRLRNGRAATTMSTISHAGAWR